jgi:hypothetical protein
MDFRARDRSVGDAPLPPTESPLHRPDHREARSVGVRPVGREDAGARGRSLRGRALGRSDRASAHGERSTEPRTRKTTLRAQRKGRAPRPRIPSGGTVRSGGAASRPGMSGRTRQKPRGPEDGEFSSSEPAVGERGAVHSGIRRPIPQEGRAIRRLLKTEPWTRPQAPAPADSKNPPRKRRSGEPAPDSATAGPAADLFGGLHRT